MFQASSFRALKFAVLFSAVVMVLFALGGCAASSTKSTPEEQIIAAQLETAKKATVEFTCPSTGCVIGTFSYMDPRDRNNIKLPTNGYDVINTFVGTAGTVIGNAVLPVVGAKVLIKGFESLRDSKGATTTTSSTTSSTTSTSNTASTGSVAGGGSISTLDSHNNTAATDAVAGGGTVTTDNHSATATPTVVTVPGSTVKVCVVDPATSVVTCQ